MERMRETTLGNGLKVLVREEHTAPLASVWCWYKVGSKDERPGLTGVSHWVEHMNFKGTTNIPRDQVKGIIEQFGGSWNGYTWIDQTTYLETATRDALDRMLFIESERMARCLYDPEGVRTVEPTQVGERRVTIRKEGTAAYLKVAYHAPAVSDRMFVPALVLDAVLTGAKGVNLWSSFRVPPPQRSARLYRALVERGLASSIYGALVPTEDPFLYVASVTAKTGGPTVSVESALIA